MKLYLSTAMLSRLCIVYGRFHATVEEVSSCYRDCMTRKE